MATSGLRIRGLGPLEVSRDGENLALGGLKQRIVLGALVLNPNRVVSRGRLLDAVWEDQEPADAIGTLQVYVANLRRIADPDRSAGIDGPLIRSVAPGYLLNTSAHVLDLLAFEDLTEHARAAGELEQTRQLLAESLGLWRGDLLEDLQGHHFLHGETARWDELRRSTERDLVRTELALGNHEGVVPQLEGLIAASPYDEDLAALRMIALYRSGRQSESLEAFNAVRGRLVEDLGVEPGPALRGLEIQILNHDPKLDLVVAAAPAMAGETVRAPGSVSQAPAASIITDGTDYPLTRTITTLGRIHDRDIVVPDDQASRRHAEIRRASSTFLIADLGSTNGTYVNGDRIESRVLEDGDLITIGDTQLRFRLAAGG